MVGKNFNLVMNKSVFCLLKKSEIWSCVPFALSHRFRKVLLFSLPKKYLLSLLIQQNVTVVTVKDKVNVRPKKFFSRSKNY